MDIRSRRNHRSQKEFEGQFTKEKYQQEHEYAEFFVAAHNKIRKKIAFIILPWGAKLKGIVINSRQVELNRPDYLLLELEDNRRLVRAIRPLEICSFYAPIEGNKFYIKAWKVDNFYDNLTKAIATLPQCLLCILGERGKEKYYPVYGDSKVFRKMKQRGKEKVKAFGDKWGYHFYTSEVRWQYLYPQPRLGGL